MRVDTDIEPQLIQTGRIVELLQALNSAAALLQRSAHSETAVFEAYREQLARLKLRGGLTLLDESGEHLTVRVTNYAGRIGRVLNRLENAVNIRTESFTFAVAGVDVYRQVVETGESLYVADSSAVIAQMLPPKARRFLGRILVAFGGQPAIYAPLINEGQVRGIINVVDASLTVEDLPALTAFANHIAVALENAKLFEKARQRAEELEKRVEERTSELATANEQLKELDRLRSSLITNISHELRTPIANLELYLHLLSRGPTEKRDHYQAVMKEQVGRLMQLMDDILNLSLLEAGKVTAIFAPVQLNEVVEQAIANQRPRAEANGLELTFEPGANLPQIQAIRGQLARATRSLVSNSINYTVKGSIRVSTYLAANQDQVYLQVSDTGIGIRPEDQPHIWERFYRGQYNDQEDLPGTGLGLAIVKEIVDIHGGQIDFESEVGVGTTFWVGLPLSPQHNVEGE